MRGLEDFSQEELLEEIALLKRQLEERDEHMMAHVTPVHCSDIPLRENIDKEIIEFQVWMFQNYPDAGFKYAADDDGGRGAIEEFIRDWRQDTFNPKNFEKVD